MKKLSSLLLAVLLLAALLTGCANQQDGNALYQEMSTVPQTNGSLTVFCIGDSRDSDMLELALNCYRDQYPEIAVKLIKPETDSESKDELYQQVAAQIMAGEGPDVFIVDDSVLDMEKLVRQGIFADMEPFFEADNFDWEPYHKTVMDGGVWNGKRFAIPLSYDFPLLFTTRTALEETGFDTEACKDYQGFLEETTHYMKDPTQTRPLFHNVLCVTDVTGFSGISIVDYDTRTADLSSPALQLGLQWYKTVMENHPNYNQISNGLENAAVVRDGQALWTTSILGALYGFYNEFAALKTVDEAIMMPIRDLDGGIQAKIKYSVAVRANSDNLQNAYDYIKILLSPEVQCKLQNGDNLSVLNSANEYCYQEISQGRIYHLKAGSSGFVSTIDPEQAVDWPSPEDFLRLMDLTQEITGTYYKGWGIRGAMYSYVFENADYEDTLDAAKRQLEIYISE